MKTMIFTAAMMATTLLMVTATPVAQAQDWFVSPSESSAHVTGAIDRPASGLYGVEITEINGVRVGEGRRDGVWLKPGTYTIEARRATVRGDLTGSVGKASRHIPANNRVELEVEAGKTYYLALDTNPQRQADWKVVVWDTE